MDPRNHSGADLPPLEQRSFLSFDGTPIGYQVVGNPAGIPLLFANGLGGTIEAYRFVIARFSPYFRCYAWDYRGMYTSGRPLGGYEALRIESHARDGLALMAHENLHGGFAFGWSMGVQVLLEMARSLPSGAWRGLVLHNGVAGSPYHSLAGTDVFARWVPKTLRALQQWDGLVAKAVGAAVDFPLFIPTMCRLGLTHHELDREVFSTIARNFKQLDMHLYLEALHQLGEHDASDVLSTLSMPTLLLASTHDRMTPLTAAQRMHDKIPDCELEVIPNGTHYAAVEFPALINRLLCSWFTRRFALKLDDNGPVPSRDAADALAPPEPVD